MFFSAHPFHPLPLNGSSMNAHLWVFSCFEQASRRILDLNQIFRLCVILPLSPRVSHVSRVSFQSPHCIEFPSGGSSSDCLCLTAEKRFLMSSSSGSPAAPPSVSILDKSLQFHAASILELIEGERAKLKEEREALELEKENWKKSLPFLEATQLADPVQLNVGGTSFATSMETLTRLPGTYFSALLSGRWSLKTFPPDGSIFIDRDPAFFSYVISYLRDSPEQFKERISSLSEAELRRLFREFDFYMIPVEAYAQNV